MPSNYTHVRYVAKGIWQGISKSGRQLRVTQLAQYDWEARGILKGAPHVIRCKSLAEINDQLAAS